MFFFLHFSPKHVNLSTIVKIILENVKFHPINDHSFQKLILSQFLLMIPQTEKFVVYNIKRCSTSNQTGHSVQCPNEKIPEKYLKS